MKPAQFLLLKLSEECSEVQQRASKQIQFGRFEVQNGQGFTNAERLKQELLDLFSIVYLLQEKKEIPEITHNEFRTSVVNKKQKLQKYLALSNELGELPEITL